MRFATTTKLYNDNNTNDNKYREIEELQVLKLTQHGILPQLGSPGAAGYDLFSPMEVIVPMGASKVILLDIAIVIPDGWYGRIAPRSGLAVRHGIAIGGGVIDSDFRGNVGVIIFNHGKDDYQIKHGDRIAQLLLEKIMRPAIREVSSVDATERGHNGFGSTGRGGCPNSDSIIS